MKNRLGLGAACGAIVGGAAAWCVAMNQKNKSVNDFDKVEKFKKYYNMLNQWMMLRNMGKGLEEYFEERGYTDIAIYGMGEMGERFLEEMRQSNKMNVKYAVDKNPEYVLADIKTVSLENELETVDAIIVTSIFAFDTIKAQIERTTEIPIISLEEVIQELL